MQNITFNKFNKTTLENRFHSLCRNFNNFEDISNEEIEYAKEIAQKLKNQYSKFPKDLIYYKNLDHLCSNYYNYPNKDIMPLILIFSIDPDLYIYKVYESFSKIKDIKKRMNFIFGFNDEKIIKYEKEYIKKFLNIDNYDFTKKLEP